ncbi:unnamed protein product [Timema podura]|uniref:Serpin domain-containing protein n=1 Tax=Timema podura TaxID=61482 RepID=A0ABN7PJJ1_TIMPD|nr:unnamed protein product [Timema podura]
MFYFPEPGKSNCCEHSFWIHQKIKAIVIKNRMMQPYVMDNDKKVLVFKANHPFLFFLRDKSTGIILFVGRYIKP